MTLIPISLAFADGFRATVIGEKLTPHFALAPTASPTEDGTSIQLTGRLALVHILSGRTVSHDTWLDLRKLATELEDLPLDWTRTSKWASTEEEIAHVRAAFSRAMTDDGADEWPWPEWAGDSSTPALSLLARRLDDALTSDRRHENRRALEKEVTALDPELGKRVGTDLLWMLAGLDCDGYGLTYLLAVLHRIDPAAADRAAANLVRDWDAGDSMGEWTYQWRKELGAGQPLTLYGFPHIPTA